MTYKQLIYFNLFFGIASIIFFTASYIRHSEKQIKIDAGVYQDIATRKLNTFISTVYNKDIKNEDPSKFTAWCNKDFENNSDSIVCHITILQFNVDYYLACDVINEVAGCSVYRP